jgi:hypothetical protein
MAYVINQRMEPDPQNIGGMALWLRADRGILYSGTSTVTGWLDYSPFANHVYQTGIYCPTGSNFQINGRPTVLFTGVTYGFNGTYLDCVNSSSLQFQSGAIYAVMSMNMQIGTQDSSVIVGNAVTNGGTAALYSGFQSSVQYNNGTADIDVGGTSGTYNRASSSHSFIDSPTARPHLYEGYLDPTLYVFNDGRSGPPTARTVTIPHQNIYPFRVGAALLPYSTNRYFFLKAHLAELIIFNRSLDNGERLLLRNYFFQRYRYLG